jgi:hypothetical protein
LDLKWDRRGIKNGNFNNHKFDSFGKKVIASRSASDMDRVRERIVRLGPPQVDGNAAERRRIDAA